MTARWGLSLVVALSIPASAAVAKVITVKKVIRRTVSFNPLKVTHVVITTSGGRQKIIFQRRYPRKVRFLDRRPRGRGISALRQSRLRAKRRLEHRSPSEADWAYRISGLPPRPSDYYGNGKWLRR